MTGLLVMVFLTALALAVPRYGMDSRDGRDWGGVARRTGSEEPRLHTPLEDLRQLRGAVRRFARRTVGAWRAQEHAWGACWQAHQPWRGDDLPAHHGELRWRQADGRWRLEGRTMPGRPPLNTRHPQDHG